MVNARAHQHQSNYRFLSGGNEGRVRRRGSKEEGLVGGSKGCVQPLYTVYSGVKGKRVRLIAHRKACKADILLL